jgi:hypothetical protein
MSAPLKCSSAIFKLPFLPSIGLLRNTIGNTENSGDLKIYRMLEEMFFEPTEVLLELVAGMQSAGLRLSKEGPGGGDSDGEGEGVLRGQTRRSDSTSTSGTTSNSSYRCRENTRRERGSPSVFCSTTVPEADAETFHIEDHIGLNESNILLICGTEDLLVPEADVILTFEAIVENARLDPHRDRSFCSKIISVGKKAGHRSSYSHFDLIFSVDAVIDVFPQILDFIILTENKDEQFTKS